MSAMVGFQIAQYRADCLDRLSAKNFRGARFWWLRRRGDRTLVPVPQQYSAQCGVSVGQQIVMPSISLKQSLDLSAPEAHECRPCSCVVTELDGEVCMKATTALEPSLIRAGQECFRIAEGEPDRCFVLSGERVLPLVERGAKDFADGVGG